MGGTVAVTVRDPDGVEYRMNRWTNTLPGFLCDNRFFDEPGPHLESYLSHWQEMKADWGLFKLPMTQVYAPYPALLAPNGYGLVVVDMTRKRVLSMQGYCSTDRLHIFPGAHRAELTAARELARASRLLSGGVPFTESELDGWLVRQEEKTGLAYLDLRVNTAPYVHTRFDEDEAGARELLAAIKDLGFTLSDEEHEAWAEWLKELGEAQ